MRKIKNILLAIALSLLCGIWSIPVIYIKATSNQMSDAGFQAFMYLTLVAGFIAIAIIAPDKEW